MNSVTTLKRSLSIRLRSFVLGAAAVGCASILPSCQAIEGATIEFTGGGDEIRWMSAPPTIKDSSGKNNKVYLSVQDMTGDLEEAVVRGPVEEHLKAKGYIVERDPNVADFQLKVLVRNLYEGAPTDRMGEFDNKPAKGVKFTMVVDVRIAERVPEGLVVKSQARECTSLTEVLNSGDQDGETKSGNSFVWARESRAFFATYFLRAQVFNRGSGLASSKGTSIRNMATRLAKSLPGLFPQVG
jgi:hypothetical protein